MRLGGTAHMMAGNDAVIATWSPIEHKLVQGIFLVFLRMLFPVRIVEVNTVCRIKILLLKRLEETVHHLLFRIIAEDEIQDDRKYNDDNRDQDHPVAALGRSRIIFSGIHQSHQSVPLKRAFEQQRSK